MPDPLIGIDDAIEALRAGLTTAMERGEGQPMRFELEPIELTVQAAVTKDADGKIGWSILGLGGSYSHAQTQTVTLRLTPLWRDDRGELTPDFTVSSVGEPGDIIGGAGAASTR